MTAVYEWHNEAGELLYIGVSEDVVSRASRHEAAKAWWEEVAYSRVTHYPTRAEALAVERVLIRHYQPTYNIRHNPRAKLAKATPQGVSTASVLPIVEAMDRANVPLDASINRSLLMLRASGSGYRRAYVAAALRVRRARIQDLTAPFEPSLEDLEALPDPW